ncbi:MAG: hypothetical protein KR126chlam1_00322 [Chlamydiae bacterium]|nr:hypothetical protein [Chlamydiota bacterium]
MNKKWIAEFLAVVISLSSMTPLGASDILLPSHGREIVAQTEVAYQRGDYDLFLEQLHEQYENAGEAGALRGVFESAKAAFAAAEEKGTANFTEQRKRVQILSKQRNEALREAVANSPEREIAQKVHTITAFSLSKNQKEVLDELDQLKLHVPDNADGVIQNKISALETEYYIKSLLLDIAGSRSGSDAETLQKKKIALNLEKLDKMEEAAKGAGDVKWAAKIGSARIASSADHAYKIDLNSLNELADGKVDPKNSVEEKVKDVMISYQQKRADAYQDQIGEIAQK